MNDVVAVVLAGGAGRRLGGIDKPLLRIGGTTMLERIVEALDAEAVAINANGDSARYAGFGLPVLADSIVDQGPLAGVLAGLNWAAEQGARSLLTVPGDTPFIPRDLARRLTPAPACASSGGRVHHLVALWPVECRIELHAMLSVPGPRHVVRFADRLGMRQVAFEVGGWDPFMNVNTPAEFAAARAVAEPGQTEG